MIRIAITGVIGSGKSTLAKIMKDLGIPVLDADEISRELTDKGSEVYEKVVRFFGKQILDSNEEIDRKALAKIVFNDREKRLFLESLIHPEVKKAFEKKIIELEKQGFDLVVLDIPLLFEAKMEDTVDFIILAYAEEDTLFERVKKRDKLSREEFMLRLKNQIPIHEKVKKSHFVVHTEKDLKKLKSELDKIISNIRESVRNSQPC